MEPQTEAPLRRRSPRKPRFIKAGDRVTFTGSVLRVLSGDERTLLIMVDATGVKLTIKAHWFENGNKLKGSDPVTLAGTVTHVGDPALGDSMPVSMVVDGFVSARVTMTAKWLTRALGTNPARRDS